VRKTYPTGESEIQTYNRQGEVQTLTDPNGTKHFYNRDKFGRLIDDQIQSLGSDVNDLVLRISTTYDERGRVQYVTSASDPHPGQGSIINQIAYTYNGIDCLTSEAQSHSGPVGASTPKVQYTCSAAQNNVLRRTSIIYPNGRALSYEYGAAGSVDDVLNRVQSVHDSDLTVLSEFQYLGAAMPAVTTLPL
jgi:YD repeat-containing protein